MKLARVGGPWPTFTLPECRGSIRPADVVAQPPGEERLKAIRAWAESAWEPWSGQRDDVLAFLRESGIVP